MPEQPQQNPHGSQAEPDARSRSPDRQSRGSSTLVSDEPESISRGSLAAAFSAFNFTRHRENEAKSVDSSSFFHKDFTNPFQRKKDKGDDDKEDEETEESQQRVGLQLLHACPEPLIDIVFVHGLKGHPVKTWRESGKPRSLWPQYWLPEDPEFQHVNVHTFGYEAEVARGSSILNVADFGQTLLEEMRNSPHLRNNENSPIILIGHSLGGLVIKKALVAASEVAEFRQRIRTIFFLGTPHGGSDLARTLSNVLTVAGSSRGYLKDLSSGSTAVQLINDAFEQRAHDMPIFSFFETNEMRLGGIMSEIVVPKSSAILGSGFTNQRVQYLNADHRGLVKFSHPKDDNYLKLKKAMAGAVYDLLREVKLWKRKEEDEQTAFLKACLAISTQPDEEHDKIEGSCRWINDRSEFREWLHVQEAFQISQEECNVRNKPAIIWIHAKPGTGKSVLAQHVISNLRKLKYECACYYFHAGNESSSSLSDFLCSMAFQMAMVNTEVRRTLIRLCKEDSTFEFEDDRTLWTRLFSNGIFRSKILTPQYWVIDALDECAKYADLLKMWKGEQPDFPLRIFITSRDIPDLERLYRPLQATATVCSMEIPVTATMNDIERYIRGRIDHLPLDTDAEREELASIILRRSDASFLWVCLVMDRLETVYSKESILRVLEELPEGMVPYYERAIRDMAKSKMEQDISKAILLWVVACSRRMTTLEVSHALKLDVKRSLVTDKRAIEGLCGQFVRVDSKSDTVNVVHPTAREFLLSDAAGEFRVHRAFAHTRIVMACLEALKGPEMQSLKNRRMIAARKMTDNPFLGYAITQLFEHIYGASAESDQVFKAMDRFFKTNVLSWIERVARRGNLQVLIRASRNLRSYLRRRAKYRSPFDTQATFVEGWSTDLSRLVTKFGEALLKDPISIHFFIPPLCPSTSSIYSQFGKRPSGIVLAGFKNKNWDDCIASVTLGEEIPVGLSCGENHIAVSLASREISLYSQQSFQKVGLLKSKWPVDLVHFSGEHVVVATMKTLLLLDLRGNPIWEKRTRSRMIYLTSDEVEIFSVSQNGHLIIFAMEDGSEVHSECFEYMNHDIEKDYNRVVDRAPAVAAISPDKETLGMGYRGGTVCLWDIPSSEFIGWAHDEDEWQPEKMMFNPNPEIKLLFIVYNNHRLSLFDSFHAALVKTMDPEIGRVLSIAASNDGLTAATVDAKGALRIWDFETLDLLYHLDTPPSPQRMIGFNAEDTAIVDLSTSGMRVWSPTVLNRKKGEENVTISDNTSRSEVRVSQYAPKQSAQITARCAHPSWPIVFAGTSKGNVFAFSTKTGERLSDLYRHPHGDRIICIAVGQEGNIASSDDGNNTLVWEIDIGRGGAFLRITSQVLEERGSAVVKQLCFSTSGQQLLISDALVDTVYSFQDSSATVVGSMTFGLQGRKTWKWIAVDDQHGSDGQFSLLCDRVIKSFSISEFPTAVTGSEIKLDYELKEGDVEKNITNIELDTVTRTLILDIYQNNGVRSSTVTFLFDLSHSSPGSDDGYKRAITPKYRFSSDFCKSFIGLSKKTKNFIFLDGNSWLSTLELNKFEKKPRYLQHFYVPNEYLPSRYEEDGVRPAMAVDDDIAFCLYGDLAVIKNGLKFQDEKPLDLKKYVVWGREKRGTVTETLRGDDQATLEEEGLSLVLES